MNDHKTGSYTNIKLHHFPNMLGSTVYLEQLFYFKNILKYILVLKLLLFRVTNQIGKINPILNGPKISDADPDLWILICIIKVGSRSVWRDTNLDSDPGHKTEDVQKNAMAKNINTFFI